MISLALESPVFTWVLLPIIIFLCRIVDVTIGTARVIFVSRGYRILAACTGFFEVLIWLIAIGQIMRNLSNPLCYVAYASGFALGNFIGITLTEKLSLGTVLVRVIINKSPEKLIDSLKKSGYGVTSLEGIGAYGTVNIVFTIVPRAQVNQIVEIIKSFNPQAFFTIEEIGRVSETRFRARRKFNTISPDIVYRLFRKGK